MNLDDMTFEELREEMVKLGILKSRSDRNEGRRLQSVSQ